jgi:hypothetical protein
MEFFPGFRWAVPTAFAEAEAVSLCRFEDGDVIYDTRAAYDDEWGTASQQIEYSIQVLYPPRETGGREVDKKGVFKNSWRSEVKLTLRTHSEGTTGLSASVPEPGALALLGVGLAGLAALRKRKPA